MIVVLTTVATGVGVLIVVAAVMDLALRVADRMFWHKGDRG